MNKGSVLWTSSVPAELETIAKALSIGSCSDEPWALSRHGHHDLLLTGVGKANVAGSIARALDPDRHALVVNAGVAGALTGEFAIGDVALASKSFYLDEGVQTDEGMIGIASLGFAPGPGDRDSYEPPAPLADGWVEAGGRLGVIGTVSSGAGTDLLRDGRARMGASMEAMEGAAAMQVAAHVGVAGLELRAVSNTTGDRAQQRWDLPGALVALGSGVLRLARLIG